MQKASDLIEATGNPTATKPTLNAAWIAALFTRFRGRYGRLWSSQFASEALYDEAKREWGIVLAGLEGDYIERGLAVWDGEYPPNAYEFRKACQRPKVAHRIYRALPKPKSDPEKARAGFNAIREKLK